MKFSGWKNSLIFIFGLLCGLSIVGARGNVDIVARPQPFAMVTTSKQVKLPSIHFMTLNVQVDSPFTSFLTPGNRSVLVDNDNTMDNHVVPSMSIERRNGSTTIDSPAFFIVDFPYRNITDETLEFLVESDSDIRALVKIQYGDDSFLSLDDSSTVLSNTTSKQTMTRMAFARFHVKGMLYNGAGKYFVKIVSLSDQNEPKAFNITVRLSNPTRYYRFQMTVPFLVFLCLGLIMMMVTPKLCTRLSISSSSPSDQSERPKGCYRFLLWLFNTLETREADSQSKKPFIPIISFEDKKDLSYLMFFLVLGLMQAIPGVQLIWKTLGNFYLGDEYACHFNSLCAHQYGWLYALNKATSGCSFIFAGIFYILIVVRRDYLFRLRNGGALVKDRSPSPVQSKSTFRCVYLCSTYLNAYFLYVIFSPQVYT